MNYKEILNDIVNNSDTFRKITEDEKSNLQNELYKMACDLDDVCKINSINLFLVGGSLLGAVRHGGFIPWDDDMDLALCREDYEKLKEIFEEELGDRYILTCPNYKTPSGNRFMQIYKKETVLRTLGDSNPFVPPNIYIDIFPYDYVPDNLIKRIVIGSVANVCMAIASCVIDYKYPDKNLELYMKKHKRGKKLFFIKNFIGRIFSFKKPEKWFDLVDKVIAYRKKTSLITSGTGRKHYFGEIYNKSTFFPLSQIQFGKHYFCCPNDSDVYLKGLYGETYMEIPKETNRESHFISELKL